MRNLKQGILILPFSVLVVILVSGCLGGGNGNIIIDEGSVLDQSVCESKGLAEQVTVFHSPTCGACKVTVPVLEEIERESDVRFEFIDVSTQRDRIDELGIAPGHVPAVIIKCRVYAGYKTKEQFEELIY